MIELNQKGNVVTLEMGGKLIAKYLGVPYVHKGRDIKGLDCWGFIKCVYRDLGIELFDIEGDYDKDWSEKEQNLFIENYYHDWEAVVEPRVFDVVLFKNHRGISNHGGIVLGNGKFIHCVEKAGVVVDKLYPVWRKRFSGYFRCKELW